MILHRVTVEHLGPYRETASVGPFDAGLNVIDAPNETGKSTLFLAATRALFDRHTSKGAEIRALQPVETKVGPIVEIEFETDAGRYSLRKRFLESPESRLQEWSENSWRLLAQADRADDLVLELLGAESKARGASKPEHWGLLRTLWTRQGELMDWPQWTAGETNALPSAMASAPLEPVADTLLEKWRPIYEESFTRTGQVRANGSVDQASREQQRWAAQVDDLEAKLETVESKAQRHERVSRDRERLKRELEDRIQTEDTLAEQRRQTALAQKDIQGLEAAFAKAEAELRAVREDLIALERNERDREALERDIIDLEQKLGALKDQSKSRNPEIQAAKKRVDHAAEQSAGTREKRERWRRLQELANLTEESRRLEHLLERVQSKSAALKGLEIEWGALPEISSQRLQALREMDRRRVGLETTLHAQGLRWRVLTENTQEIRLQDGSGDAIPWSTSAGEATHAETGPEATIRIDGWGEITVQSGAQTVAELQRELQEARGAWTAALKSHGLESMEAVETAAARYASLEQEIQWRRAGLNEDLGDYESVNAVDEAIATRERTRSRRIAQDQFTQEEIDLAPDAVESALSRCDSKIQHFEEQKKTAQEEADAMTAEAEERREKRVAIDRDLSGQRVLLQRLGIEKETIQKRYAAPLEEVLEDRQAVFVRAEARLVQSQTTLPKDWATVEERHQRAVAATEACRLEYDSLREEGERLRGELEAHGGQAWFSQLTKAREQLARARSRHAFHRREALAAGYLRRLMERKRDAAVERALAPLEDRLSTAFAELTGVGARRVFLGPQMDLLGVGENRDRIIPFRQLSQGAKEQLLLALRAAIARSLNESERPCLVLDDALVNADPDRQERVLSFLNTLAQDAQIILLTCDASRYRGVGQRMPISIASPQV